MKKLTHLSSIKQALSGRPLANFFFALNKKNQVHTWIENGTASEDIHAQILQYSKSSKKCLVCNRYDAKNMQKRIVFTTAKNKTYLHSFRFEDENLTQVVFQIGSKFHQIRLTLNLYLQKKKYANIQTNWNKIVATLFCKKKIDHLWSKYLQICWKCT